MRPYFSTRLGYRIGQKVRVIGTVRRDVIDGFYTTDQGLQCYFLKGGGLFSGKELELLDEFALVREQEAKTESFVNERGF